MEKKKILTISDSPLFPSGVAHQAREFIGALLETGRYEFVCIGGGLNGQNIDPRPVKTDIWGEEHKDDVVIYHVSGYGDKNTIRTLIGSEKPDVLWYMTDPRFYEWLHTMSDEILLNMPMVWYTIWDNYPVPKFNKRLYKCNTHLACISKLTHNIVQELVPNISNSYMPHFVDDEIFKKLPAEEVLKAKEKIIGDKDKFVFFYNSRNAMRKQTGSTIYWFRKFLDIVGEDKAVLLMHTNPSDPNGPNLHVLANDIGLTDRQVIISIKHVSPATLAMFYNVADCTVMLSNAEGWGLAITESMSCETPVLATKTGGMIDQIIGKDGGEFGVAIEPSAQPLMGSQGVPYIFQDDISESDAVNGMLKMYNMSKSDRDTLGNMARQHVLENYKYSDMRQKWVELIDSIIEENGSWDTRKNYNPWKRFQY